MKYFIWSVLPNEVEVVEVLPLFKNAKTETSYIFVTVTRLHYWPLHCSQKKLETISRALNGPSLPYKHSATSATRRHDLEVSLLSPAYRPCLRLVRLPLSRVYDCAELNCVRVSLFTSKTKELHFASSFL